MNKGYVIWLSSQYGGSSANTQAEWHLACLRKNKASSSEA